MVENSKNNDYWEMNMNLYTNRINVRADNKDYETFNVFDGNDKTLRNSSINNDRQIYKPSLTIPTNNPTYEGNLTTILNNTSNERYSELTNARKPTTFKHDLTNDIVPTSITTMIPQELSVLQNTSTDVTDSIKTAIDVFLTTVSTPSDNQLTLTPRNVLTTSETTTILQESSFIFDTSSNIPDSGITTALEADLTTVTNETTEDTTFDQGLTPSSSSSTTLPVIYDPPGWSNVTALPEETVSDMLATIPGLTLKPPPSIDPNEGILGTTNDILDVIHPYVTSTKNPIQSAIEEEMRSTRNGHFTCSLTVLLRNLVFKNTTEVRLLLYGMNMAIVNFTRDGILSIFTPGVVRVYQSTVQMLVVEPADTMRAHIGYAIYALENRRTFLRPETNSLIDIVETVYNDGDVKNIAIFIRDEIAGFPNITDDAVEIACKALNLFVIYPYRRIEGTEKDQRFMMQLNALIKSRFPHGYLYGRRLGGARNSRIVTEHHESVWNKEIAKKSFKHKKQRLRYKFDRAPQSISPPKEKWKQNLNENIIKRNTRQMYKSRRNNNKKHTKLNDNLEHYTKETSLTNSTANKSKYLRNLNKINTLVQNKVKSRRKPIEDTSNENDEENILKPKMKESSVENIKDIPRRRNNSYNLSSRKILRENNDLIKDKILNWVNKHTNIIYQKLKNQGRSIYRTKLDMLSSSPKINKIIVNTPRHLSKINNVGQKKVKNRRKALLETSEETNEEILLKLKIFDVMHNNQ